MTKTKNDLLEEFGMGVVPFDENVTMYLPAIHSAMDEYAEQKAIEFQNWITVNYGYNYPATKELYSLFNSQSK